jgi:hypothetical protein
MGSRQGAAVKSRGKRGRSFGANLVYRSASPNATASFAESAGTMP